ncbi:MAG TPA: hypothetical protein EYP36_09660 [Calditrichaeota bacterium]|nr:hypothetical protein [Calditrichota bacterium]
MNKHILEQHLERLSERLRILILQNARYESDYDLVFLKELYNLSHHMLLLKKQLQKVEQAEDVPIKVSEDVSLF